MARKKLQPNNAEATSQLIKNNMISIYDGSRRIYFCEFVDSDIKRRLAYVKYYVDCGLKWKIVLDNVSREKELTSDEYNIVCAKY